MSLKQDCSQMLVSTSISDAEKTAIGLQHNISIIVFNYLPVTQTTVCWRESTTLAWSTTITLPRPWPV